MNSKVLLRLKASQKYLGSRGEWVERAEAYDFQEVEVAHACGKSSGISGIEVVLEIDGYELILPLLDPDARR